MFHCDLSYDGSPPGNVSGRRHEPRTYVVGGILARPEVSDRLVEGLRAINAEFGVARFHGAHLNGRTYEYDGWDRHKAEQYSEALLSVLNRQPQATAFCCGVFADCYKEI
jgi:hypothetical protein